MLMGLTSVPAAIPQLPFRKPTGPARMYQNLAFWTPSLCLFSLVPFCWKLVLMHTFHFPCPLSASPSTLPGRRWVWILLLSLWQLRLLNSWVLAASQASVILFLYCFASGFEDVTGLVPPSQCHPHSLVWGVVFRALCSHWLLMGALWPHLLFCFSNWWPCENDCSWLLPCGRVAEVWFHLKIWSVASH